jgi:hypothetical protein
MNKMKNYLFVFGFLLPFLTYGQDSFVPENLGEKVNSQYPEAYPLISPDNEILFFVRANDPQNNYGAENSQDIWYTKRMDDGTWSVAERLPAPFNTGRHNAVMAVSADGNKIYINGIYDKNLKWKKRGISTVTRLGGMDFSNPTPLKIKGFHKMNKGLYTQMFITDDENVMLLSFCKKWDSKNSNIFISTKKSNGTWKRPKKIKKPVSTKNPEFYPYMSKDGTKIIFSTVNKKGSSSFDLFYVEKTDENYKRWSAPKPYSDTINSVKWDAGYSINSKGNWLYYASNILGEGSSDIFRIKLFEDNPFIKISGIVINKVTGQPFTGKPVILTVNGSAADSVEIDPVDAKYSVTLPLGSNYILSAESKDYIPQPDTIKASQIKEYKEITQNLYISPLPYVDVSGRILVKGSVNKVSSSSHPEIFINGNRMDSVKINADGTYEMRLENARAYVIRVNADHFHPDEVKLDLRDVKEYQKIEKDLFVQKIPEVKVKEAIMTGKIINSKTKMAIDSTVAVEIFVNDFPSAAVTIEDSTYTLRLPLGEKYAINASAKNNYADIENIDLRKENEKVKIL